MRARKPGRYLAPLALVAVIVAAALVVRGGLATTHHTTTTTSTSTTTRLPATHRGASEKRFYIIHPGDTLSSIAMKTGVSVGQLQVLNHSVASDPNALQTGQRLRLRR